MSTKAASAVASIAFERMLRPPTRGRSLRQNTDGEKRLCRYVHWRSRPCSLRAVSAQRARRRRSGSTAFSNQERRRLYRDGRGRRLCRQARTENRTAQDQIRLHADEGLIAGQIDSVDMGAAESIVAAVRGTGVKIVGCNWPGVPQIVLAKAEIKTPADLKGKAIAISSPGSLPDLLMRGMLNAENIPVADVKFVTHGADLDRYKSLVAGVTDAAVVSNEFEAIMPPNIKVLMRANVTVP